MAAKRVLVSKAVKERHEAASDEAGGHAHVAGARGAQRGEGGAALRVGEVLVREAIGAILDQEAGTRRHQELRCVELAGANRGVQRRAPGLWVLLVDGGAVCKQ